MAEKCISLHGGKVVRCYELVSAEADFSKGTWSFRIPDDDTQIGAGEYLVISVVDLQRAATAGEKS